MGRTYAVCCRQCNKLMSLKAHVTTYAFAHRRRCVARCKPQCTRWASTSTRTAPRRRSASTRAAAATRCSRPRRRLMVGSGCDPCTRQTRALVWLRVLAMLPRAGVLRAPRPILPACLAALCDEPLTGGPRPGPPRLASPGQRRVVRAVAAAGDQLRLAQAPAVCERAGGAPRAAAQEGAPARGADWAIAGPAAAGSTVCTAVVHPWRAAAAKDAPATMRAPICQFALTRIRAGGQVRGDEGL